MKWYTKLWTYPLLLINAGVSAIFVLCAYSQHIPAARLPLVSLAGLAFPFALAGVVAFLVFWLLFRRRCCWLSVVTLLACAPQIYTMCPVNLGRTHEPEGDVLKVLSYNVLSDNLHPSKVGEDNPILQCLQRSQADIICLQECNQDGLKKFDTMSDWLQGYPYRSYDVVNWSPAASHYIVCLSRYPILTVEKFNFEKSSNGILKHQIDLGGDTLTLYNCHLQSFGLTDEDKSKYNDILFDPKDNLATSGTMTLVKKLRDAAALRAVQADTLAADVARILNASDESTHPIIVCGDFNDSPVSYAHHRLTQHLDDAYVHSGNGFGFSYTHDHMYFRIDHILASPDLHPYGCRIDRSIRESDHYPISTSFVRHTN